MLWDSTGRACFARVYGMQPLRTSLTPELFPSFLDSFDNFLFDCDGVLWQGDRAVPGAIEAISILRSLNKKVVFVTNNSTTSRASYRKKLESFGFICNEVLSGVTNKNLMQAYLIGEQGLGDEFEQNGIPYRGLKEHAFIPQNLKETQAIIKTDPEIGAVVVGLDRTVCYPKMAFALHQLNNNEGCIFVATNPDETLPTEIGELPGGGSMVQMLATAYGKPPVAVCGKPSNLLLDLIVKKYSMDTSRTIMTGDKLTTDIAWGKIGNISTLLVLTGVTSIEEVNHPDNEIIPNFIVASLGDFVKLQENTKRS